MILNSQLYDLEHLAIGSDNTDVKKLKEDIKNIRKIIAENEERYVNMKTIEVEAFVNNEGQLTVQVPSNLKEGQYHAVLIIEEPKKENQ